MDEDRFPIISKDLLDFLNEQYPEQSPNLGETTEALHWRGGQRSVIRFLNRMFEEQNDNITTTKVL